jgi:multidrug efflux pump subunit AcrA (membrane-fusion protein)
MRQDQLTRIEQSKRPSAALPIIARVTGKVVFEQGTEQQLVDPSIGDMFTITDPAYATVYIEVPAADADAFALGDSARVTLTGAKAPRSAPVGYISRSIERGQKTVRVDLHPFTGRMPPVAEATVELGRATTRGLAVPEAAVTRVDGRDVAYVVRDGGEVADPRIVTRGAADGGFVIVTSGLAAGEIVALARR